MTNGKPATYLSSAKWNTRHDKRFQACKTIKEVLNRLTFKLIKGKKHDKNT